MYEPGAVPRTGSIWVLSIIDSKNCTDALIETQENVLDYSGHPVLHPFGAVLRTLKIVPDNFFEPSWFSPHTPNKDDLTVTENSKKEEEKMVGLNQYL